MTLTRLENPKTQAYYEMKEEVLNVNFPWYWSELATPDLNSGEDEQDFGYYSHNLLAPPERELGLRNRQYYSKPISPYLERVHDVVLDILYHNDIKVNNFYRMAINCVHPTGSNKLSVLHKDHDIPHNNMITYLTDPDGGETVCEGEGFVGQEDDVIVMDGWHHHSPPARKRRVVIVSTYA